MHLYPGPLLGQVLMRQLVGDGEEGEVQKRSWEGELYSLSGYCFFFTVYFCLAGCRGRDSIYSTPVSLPLVFVFEEYPLTTPLGDVCTVTPQNTFNANSVKLRKGGKNLR